MDRPVILDPSRFKVSVNMQEVHEISLDLLTHLEESDCPPQMAVIGVALTLGRLTRREKLSPDEEQDFIQNVLDWCSMYFHTGSVN